jgi:DNA-binding transcriptional LysR family regulator
MRGELGELSAFAVVAEEKNFTRAGARMGLSQSAVSHMMRTLEAKIGIELFARTTRSVSLTAAGAALLGDLRPALEQIERSLASAKNLRERPAGKIRLVLSQAAARLVLYSKLESFAKAYPEIELDVTSSPEAVNIVAEGYDAGIHIGEFIERDMIAVRVSPSMQLAVVGSPAYFQVHKKPRSPADLKSHQCIGLRLRKNTIYRWEFAKGGRSITVAPHGRLTCSDPDFAIQAATEGLGLMMTLEPVVAPKIADGSLVRTLTDWCPSFPGYFLYYPSRRNQPSALKALIESLRV